MAYPSSTVLDRISERARQRPEAIALRRCDGTSVLRYRDLMAEVDRLAADLGRRSISGGSRVFVISDNGPRRRTCRCWHARKSGPSRSWSTAPCQRQP